MFFPPSLPVTDRRRQEFCRNAQRTLVLDISTPRVASLLSIIFLETEIRDALRALVYYILVHEAVKRPPSRLGTTDPRHNYSHTYTVNTVIVTS